MKGTPSNPPENRMPPGILDSTLTSSVHSSGYPLQMRVAGQLSESFTVTEEWGFADKDTREHRALDVFAIRGFTDEPAPRIGPILILLIECKRSKHPYIFFQSAIDRIAPRFPRVAGLIADKIDLHERGTNRFRTGHASYALQLDALPFVNGSVVHCSALSKAIPKGDKVELSGSEPYNSLILPLTKAADHATTLYAHKRDRNQIFPALVLSICVLDAPMVLFKAPDESAEPVLTPWLRVVRQEPTGERELREAYRWSAIDVVHSAYFETFVDEHVMPFAVEFASRIRHFGEALFVGGEVGSLDNWDWSEVVGRATGK